MSETKHTPGPWRWYPTGAGDLYLATTHSGRLIVMDFVRKGMQSAQPRFREQDRCVMRPFLDFVPEGRENYDGPINHPDARLIAAAPDLLEACETALRYLVAAPYLKAQLEGAIAKAKGEQQ